MRILAKLIKIVNVTPLIILLIKESLNKKADYITRYICKNRHLLSDTEFLTNFNLKFYTKQSYNLARLL